MSASEVAVLLSWLSCCGSALWRYSSNSPSYRIFSTRSVIKLEYEGTSFSKWSVPEYCNVQNETSPTTKLRCSSSGMHYIKPVGTGIDTDEERYLQVDNSDFCFLWYYKLIDNFHNITQDMIIWIYDPENASPEELLGTAKVPSLNSQVLSKQLATMGQKPYVYTFFKKQLYYSQENRMEGTWRVTVPMRPDDAIKEIKGNPVAFQDCFVANFATVVISPFELQPSNLSLLPLTSPAGTPLLFSRSTCTPTFAVIVSDMETFQTNDSFRTWVRVRVPPNILSDEDRHKVTGVSLSPEGLFLLINGIIYLKTQTIFQRLGRHKNLPDGGILGVTSRRWCWSKFILKSKSKSIVAMWTEHEIYLGYPSLQFVKIGTTTELRILLHLPKTGTLTIHTVVYSGHPLEITVFLNYCIICTDTRDIYLATFNEDLQEWVFLDFTLQIPIDSHLSAVFLFSAKPSVIIWDKHRLYYCYQDFSKNGVIQTTTGEENLSTISDGSSIHQVFADYYGNIVVKMENNVMFYFKMNIVDALKLPLWINKETKSVLLLSLSTQVYLVRVIDNNTIEADDYPLNLEVKSTTYKIKEKCPYMVFHNNIIHNFYFLDKGKNLTFWAKIIYPENLGLTVILESYGPKLFHWQQQVQYEIALGYCTKTLEISFFQRVDYLNVKDYFSMVDRNMGLTIFQLGSSEYTNTCVKPHKVFQIAAGCDTKKYIAVKGLNKKECVHHDFSYIIDKSYLRDPSSENLKITYDWIKYGCPLRIESQESYKPVIQLFDDNGFIEDIKVNFIIWEIHGRNDYSFTKTMKESGCLNVAQTWESMIQLNKSAPLEHVWGPENYKTCFSYAIGKPGDLSQPYEIINISNNNSIYWPSHHSGMYVFSVKILDPNYSFCNLVTIFAVETYGVIPRPNVYLVAAVLLVLILLVLTILVLSYFQYMQIYRRYIYEPLYKPQSKQKRN